MDCSGENILQKQDEHIQQHIFQPVQQMIINSTSNITNTELHLGPPISQNELGLINPEFDYNNDYKYEGTAKMKQRLSNRYITDYNLYKYDPDALLTDCANSGTNCDGARLIPYTKSDIVVVENSLRNPMWARDINNGEPTTPQQKQERIDNIIKEDTFDTSYPMFGTDFRQKKSCMNNKDYFNVFDVTVPVLIDDFVLSNTIVNSREYVRSISHDNEGVFIS
tara:strand:- start:299 stop:967 length:669 start_codon:yes stop_codon:yes gene_type:complete